MTLAYTPTAGPEAGRIVTAFGIIGMQDSAGSRRGKWLVESLLTATDDDAQGLERLIRGMPKVELHLHLEGTLEPDLVFALAQYNRITIPFSGVEELRSAYEFDDLQSFLDLYYQGAAVLLTKRDFFEMTRAYLQRAHRDLVRHAEVFFDPQTHTARGVPFADVITGIHGALQEAERELGLTSRLIMCFLRDRTIASAEETLDQALPFRGWLTAVGLDSAEVGNPPERFAAVFARARAAGLLAVAHAGEEGPPAYIRQALDLLHVARIDHGVRCLEDPGLVERLVAERMPLTVCPLSNVRLRVFPTLEHHNLRLMLERGLRVTVNSDDPAYFGGYITDNLLAVQRALGLNRSHLLALAGNAVEAAFVDEGRRQELRAELETYAAETRER